MPQFAIVTTNTTRSRYLGHTADKVYTIVAPNKKAAQAQVRKFIRSLPRNWYDHTRRVTERQVLPVLEVVVLPETPTP